MGGCPPPAAWPGGRETARRGASPPAAARRRELGSPPGLGPGPGPASTGWAPHAARWRDRGAPRPAMRRRPVRSHPIPPAGWLRDGCGTRPGRAARPPGIPVPGLPATPRSTASARSTTTTYAGSPQSPHHSPGHRALATASHRPQARRPRRGAPNGPPATEPSPRSPVPGARPRLPAGPRPADRECAAARAGYF